MSAMKPVSIKEVAARAGVSVGTVSHVLNGNESARISAATQERVRRAADAMGYRPNRLARSLGRQRTETIGLLISGLRNPFFVDVLESAEILARGMGYEVMVDAAPSINGTYGGHSKLAGGWPVDGVLIWAASFQSLHQFLGVTRRDTMPVVYMGSIRSDDTDWVSHDYDSGGRLATEHLIARGRRRIVYVSPYPYGIDRHEEPRTFAYRSVCAEAGLPTRLLLTHGEETREAGLRMGAEIAALHASERPDALFCHNDLIAVGVIAGLRRAGVRVPDDIAVIGFDGIEEGRYLDLPLTTVRTPGDELCRRALDILRRRLDGTAPAERENVIVPCELLPGATT